MTARWAYLGAVLAMALAGCKSLPAPSPSASASQSAVIAAGTAKGCMLQGPQFTAAGRHMIAVCIGNAVPRAHERDARICASSVLAVTVGQKPTSTERHPVQDALTGCLLKYSR